MTRTICLRWSKIREMPCASPTLSLALCVQRRTSPTLSSEINRIWHNDVGEREGYAHLSRDWQVPGQRDKFVALYRKYKLFSVMPLLSSYVSSRHHLSLRPLHSVKSHHQASNSSSVSTCFERYVMWDCRPDIFNQ